MPDVPNEAIDIFREAIEKVIDYHIREYNMTYEEMIGCFQIMQMNLWSESLDSQVEDDDGE